MSGDVAILGPTASGKTALAVALARRQPSMELASVDAFVCYRRLDIGTAKPDAAARSGLSWHLIDVVEPTEEYSITQFAAEADRVRLIVGERAGALCFVGGSGLYLRAVIDGLTPPPRFPSVSEELERQATDEASVAEMHRRLAALDPLGASRMEPSNRRRIIRALEVSLGSGRAFSSFGPGLEVYPETSCRLVGLRYDRAELDKRLSDRLSGQLERGFLDEVRALKDEGVELSRTAAQAIGYRELAEVVTGAASLDEATTEILRRSRQLARRQMAWLRRDPRIVWIDASRKDLVEHVAALLDAE